MRERKKCSEKERKIMSVRDLKERVREIEHALGYRRIDLRRYVNTMILAGGGQEEVIHLDESDEESDKEIDLTSDSEDGGQDDLTSDGEGDEDATKKGEEIVQKVGKVSLSRKHLSSIVDTKGRVAYGCFISHDVIDVFTKMLTDHVPARGAHIFTPTIGQIIMHDKNPVIRLTRQLSDRTFALDDGISLFAANPNDAHWITVRMDVREEEKTIDVYDSYGYSCKEFAEKLRNLMSETFARELTLTVHAAGIKGHSLPHQNSNNDCGVWACYYLEHLYRNPEDRMLKKLKSGRRWKCNASCMSEKRALLASIFRGEFQSLTE